MDLPNGEFVCLDGLENVLDLSDGVSDPSAQDSAKSSSKVSCFLYGKRVSRSATMAGLLCTLFEIASQVRGKSELLYLV